MKIIIVAAKQPIISIMPVISRAGQLTRHSYRIIQRPHVPNRIHLLEMEMKIDIL